MNPRARIFALLIALLVCGAANADDWTGVGLLIVGGGTLVAVVPLFFILALFRYLHWIVYGTALLIFVAALMCWFMVSYDVIHYFSREIGRHGMDAFFGVEGVFLLSLFAMIALFGLISWRFFKARRIGPSQDLAQ